MKQPIHGNTEIEILVPFGQGNQILLAVVMRVEKHDGQIRKGLADRINVLIPRARRLGAWRADSVQVIVGNQQRDAVLIQARIKLFQQV